MDLQTQLYELEQRRLKLVKLRDGLVETAEEIIDRANRDFDKDVIPLGRAINELRERLKVDNPPADKRRERQRTTVELVGLDDDDQAHYQELLTRKKKK
jgi:hypothetical protein